MFGLYFIEWVTIHYNHYFFCSDCPDFASEAPSNWSLCSFDVSPPFFMDFLTFLCSKMFQAHLVLSLPGMNLFSKEPWFL